MENKTQDELILNGVVNTDIADTIVINNEDGTRKVIIEEDGNWRVVKLKPRQPTI